VKKIESTLKKSSLIPRTEHNVLMKRKRWVGPTLGLNFINILSTAFTCADPKSIKKTVKLSNFFTLSGSMSVKAVRRMLMKFTLAVYGHEGLFYL